MKKFRYVIGVTIIALAVVLVTCFTQRAELPADDTFAALVAEVEPEYVREWPENEYTKYIVKPEFGEMNYVLDYSEAGRYAVWIKNIDKTQSGAYIEALQEYGFSKPNSKRNSVSVGTILQKDNVSLSVSYSDTDLGVLITVG